MNDQYEVTVHNKCIDLTPCQQLAPGIISGNAMKAVEMDVKMIPKAAIHCESVGVVIAGETRDIEVTIPIPKHDIPFESIGAEINADVGHQGCSQA